LDETPLTYLLIGLNVGVSLIAFTRMNSGGGDMFMFTPYEVSKGRNYPGMLLSHFSHADGGHLLFNMITLFSFGREVELRLGIPITLLIYIVSGILSTLVVYQRHRTDPSYRSLGASDSVTGILFAAIVLVPGMAINFYFIPIDIPAPVFAVAYILLSTYFMQHGRGRISHEAHLAGAFAGFVLAGLLSPRGFGPLLDGIRGLIS
jgi:membrane associated rhomboid family serine protease